MWFYAAGNRAVGPISSADLRKLADAGVVSGDTLVRKAASDKWYPAHRVKGLFPLAVELAPPPGARTAQITVDKTAMKRKGAQVMAGLAVHTSLICGGLLVGFVGGALISAVARMPVLATGDRSQWRAEAALQELESVRKQLSATQSDLDEANRENALLRVQQRQIDEKYQEALAKFSGLRAHVDSLQAEHGNDVNATPIASTPTSETMANEAESSDFLRGLAAAPGATENSMIVYVTPQGEHFHQAGCRYLRQDSTAISMEQARSAQLAPCTVCNP